MTESQKIQKELDDMMAKFRSEIAQNTVDHGGPALTRSYSYRKSPAIKASDVCSL